MKYLLILILSLCLPAQALENLSSKRPIFPFHTQLNFEIYLESWAGEQVDFDLIKKMDIYPGVTINIAFCSFDFSIPNNEGLPGLEFWINNAEAVTEIVNSVHARGGKVKISFGGASYGLGPYLKDPVALAHNIATTVQTYDLDGIDLDIEDPQSLESGVVPFIKQLSQEMGKDKILTLCAMGQDWGGKDWIVACKDFVSMITMMEYNIWVAPGTTVVDQIISDLNTYLNDWQIPAAQLQLGLMPGKADNGMITTLDDASQLAVYAKSFSFNRKRLSGKLPLAGVMLWDLNRDAAGQDGNPPFAYTKAVQAILNTKRI